MGFLPPFWNTSLRSALHITSRKSKLTHLHRLHGCWKVCTSFRKMHAPIRTTIFGKGLTYLKKTTINHKLHPWQQHGSLVEESGKTWPCSDFFLDVLLPSDSKWLHSFLKMVQLNSLNIQYIVHALLLIKTGLEFCKSLYSAFSCILHNLTTFLDQGF